MSECLTKEYSSIFDSAFSLVVKDISGIQVVQKENVNIDAEKKYSVIIGIVGGKKGRTLVIMDSDIVKKITESMNFGPFDNDQDACLYIGEFVNIFCGRAVTLINNACRSCELRLTPPAIFSGIDMRVITPKLHSSILYYTSEYGSAILDIGFEGMK